MPSPKKIPLGQLGVVLGKTLGVAPLIRTHQCTTHWKLIMTQLAVIHPSTHPSIKTTL
jgi:hypothetical protein